LISPVGIPFLAHLFAYVSLLLTVLLIPHLIGQFVPSVGILFSSQRLGHLIQRRITGNFLFSILLFQLVLCVDEIPQGLLISRVSQDRGDAPSGINDTDPIRFKPQFVLGLLNFPLHCLQFFFIYIFLI
jgi:hypothetical protein